MISEILMRVILQMHLKENLTKCFEISEKVSQACGKISQTLVLWIFFATGKRVAHPVPQELTVTGVRAPEGNPTPAPLVGRRARWAHAGVGRKRFPSRSEEKAAPTTPVSQVGRLQPPHSPAFAVI